MDRWGETGRFRRCLRRISCAVSCEAASVAASLGGIVSGRFRVGGAVESVVGAGGVAAVL